MIDVLQGKVALVTGGSSGIGRAVSIGFARAGARVGVAARRIDEGEKTVRMIEEKGGKALFIKADVSRPAEVKGMVEEVVRAYGRLDCAFNNAAITGDPAPTAECSEENWDRVISTNLKGVWLCMKYEIPHMLEQRAGAIVNMSSGSGVVGAPQLPAYIASKLGIVALTKTAALEYARTGLRINALSPGPTRTPMLEPWLEMMPEAQGRYAAETPTGRITTPEEVTEAVVWLCSDAAAFLTGRWL